MKKSELNLILYSILFFQIILLASCQNKKRKKEEKRLEGIVKNLLGSELYIPENIRLYMPFHKYKADSVRLSNAKLKIYSHIDASCPTCIRDIELWNDMSPTFEKYEVPIILVCESTDNFDLFKYMYNTKEIQTFPYPYLFVKRSDFINQNKFMKESSHFETILTDRDNKILLLGNPLNSKKIKDMYLNEIQKYMQINQYSYKEKHLN